MSERILKMLSNDWIKRFLDLSKLVSTWSKDPSTKVGAVIIDPETKTIVSTGYNGFPRNIEDSEERLNNRELKYKFVVHAEMNAIMNALYNNRSVKNCILFVHGLPCCSDCAKAIIQSKCEEELPDYEVPSYYEEIEKIPYTPNDKQDFRYLENLGNEIVKNKYSRNLKK